MRDKRAQSLRDVRRYAHDKPRKNTLHNIFECEPDFAAEGDVRVLATGISRPIDTRFIKSALNRKKSQITAEARAQTLFALLYRQEAPEWRLHPLPEC